MITFLVSLQFIPWFMRYLVTDRHEYTQTKKIIASLLFSAVRSKLQVVLAALADSCKAQAKKKKKKTGYWDTLQIAAGFMTVCKNLTC